VLEGVSRDIKASVGFKNADEELCRNLSRHFIEQYVRDELFNFDGKSARFIYLFRRMEDYVSPIVLDMLDELKNSDFEPLDFELDLSKLPESAHVLEGLHLRGVVDRVDVWTSGARTYLRVIDYKSGRKSFDLSDVLHGRDMQMLIYLFALKNHGGLGCGDETIPAGVLYVPARDVIVKAPRNTGEDELDRMRERELRRKGLILSDPGVIEAMENGESKKFLPIQKTKDGAAAGDSLVTSEQLSLLSEYIGSMLRGASGDILDGAIECSPYYKSAADNACIYCEYHSVCTFDEKLGDRRKFAHKLKPDEVWGALRGAYKSN
jgi:ATP-dependent helicase/nuclease subunit B